VPRFIDAINSAIAAHNRPDIVMFDMVHSYRIKADGRDLPPYHLHQTELARQRIDVGAAVVRTELARRVGFRDKSSEGDATYFEDLARLPGLTVAKVNSILFVHN